MTYNISNVPTFFKTYSNNHAIEKSNESMYENLYKDMNLKK